MRKKPVKYNLNQDELIRTTINLEYEICEKINDLAKREHQSISMTINDIIREY